MKILITGAAGRLGKAVRAELASAGHVLRLADIKPIEKPEGESLQLDLTNEQSVLRAMEGIEAVAHLAFGGISRQSEVEIIRGNFDVNAKSTYWLLWAAHKCRVRRFVYASTLSVFGHTSRFVGKHFSEATPPAPADSYGLTKYFGEEACRMFAREFGLSVVILRLCNLADDAEWEESKAYVPRNSTGRNWRAMTTHVSDVSRAIRLALTKPKLKFEIIHIAADNAGRLTEIQKAKDVLGFWPKWKLEP